APGRPAPDAAVRVLERQRAARLPARRARPERLPRDSDDPGPRRPARHRARDASAEVPRHRAGRRHRGEAPGEHAAPIPVPDLVAAAARRPLVGPHRRRLDRVGRDLHALRPWGEGRVRGPLAPGPARAAEPGDRGPPFQGLDDRAPGVGRARQRGEDLPLPGAAGSVLGANPRHADVLAGGLRDRRHAPARRPREDHGAPTVTSRARTLLGKGRSRISRTFSTDDERGVTAEHWGEDARAKAESEDWQGLYWQSYVLTAQHINRDISGDPAIDWLTFTKQRFFPKPVELALSLGCGYGIVERVGLEHGIARG